MSQLFLMFAALTSILVLPVMFAARMVGAERTGFGSSFVAVILQIVLSGLVEEFAADQLIAFAVAIIGGSAVYSFSLGTTLFRGFVISVIATVIALIAIFVLAGSFTVVSNTI